LFISDLEIEKLPVNAQALHVSTRAHTGIRKFITICNWQLEFFCQCAMMVVHRTSRIVSLEETQLDLLAQVLPLVKGLYLVIFLT